MMSEKREKGKIVLSDREKERHIYGRVSWDDQLGADCEQRALAGKMDWCCHSRKLIGGTAG